MTTATKLMVFLAGILHVAIFAMESIFFLNEKIYSRFLIESFEHAQIVSLFAYNQGWYNLFLALAALTGVLFVNKLPKNVGAALSMYACLSMLGAALVLTFSAPELTRAAFVQGVFPILALVLFALSLRQRAS